MRLASSVQDILSDPVGSYFAGRSFMVWFHPRLAGAFGFGGLDPADETELRELLVSPVLAAGYDLLCDVSALEVFDDRAYELLATFLEVRAADVLRTVRRLAVVRPPRLPGAAVAGLFHERLRSIVDAALFADRADALTWLGYASDARERGEIEALVAHVYAIPPLLRRLREHLIGHLIDASVGRAARALGSSERSLQRTLTAAGTSFRHELTLARVRAAEALLTTTTDKLEAIAQHLGFASAPAFSTMFHRVVGESPDEFRKRRHR